MKQSVCHPCFLHVHLCNSGGCRLWGYTTVRAGLHVTDVLNPVSLNLINMDNGES